MSTVYTYADDADLLTYIPAASVISSDLRALVLEDAKQFVDDRWFDNRTRYAHVLMTAHILALLTEELGSETGPIASQSAGAISVTYAVTAPTAAELNSTKWGRLFTQVKNSVPHAGASS
jgi:hypothetical protein